MATYINIASGNATVGVQGFVLGSCEICGVAVRNLFVVRDNIMGDVTACSLCAKVVEENQR